VIPRSLRNPIGRQSILNRLAALTPQHRRRWGRMEPAQLLPHLATVLRMALGERRLEGTPPGRIRGALLRYLVLYCLPWPKGKIQAPASAFSAPSAGWEQDRRVVVELIERFATFSPERMGADHPVFGPMSARDWDVLQYRHLDHHLRQFGV
jgi:hypothetical protein